MDICLVINTCKNYYSNINKIIKKINKYNIPKSNVLIISGQENENTVLYDRGVKIIKVTYSGLHLTGAIYIYENMKHFKNINYWVLLPDTVKFGEHFFKKIKKYHRKHLKDKEIYSLPFINPSVRPTMDMGIVHKNHIMNMGNYLHKIKINAPYTEDKLKNLKKQLIYDENIILGLPSIDITKATQFNYVNHPSHQPNIFITNHKNEIQQKLINKNIQEVYFANIDLYKYQRNFRGPDVPLVMKL